MDHSRMSLICLQNQSSGQSHEARHGGKQSLLALCGNWNALSPSIFQFGPPAGVQGYI